MDQSYIKLLIFSVIILLSACGAQSTREFSKGTENMESWTVNLPMHDVYSDYRDYSVDKYNRGRAGIIITGGMSVQSDYFGDDKGAEITIRTSTTIYSSPVLHFEFKKSQEGTLIKAWYFSNSWKKVLNDYKALD